MRDSLFFETRDRDACSRSESREREKRDGFSRQCVKNLPHDGCKLHIGRLSSAISEELLRKQFEYYGRINDLRIMRKDVNGQPLKGYVYGFITMCDMEEAQNALEGINQDKTLGWSVSYSRERLIRDDSRSPQRVPRIRNRFSGDFSEERMCRRPHANPSLLMKESEISLLRSISDEFADLPDNPDNFISYNNNTGDDHNNSFNNNNIMNDHIIEANEKEDEDQAEYSHNLRNLLYSDSTEDSQRESEVAKVTPVSQVPQEKGAQSTSLLEKKMLNGNSILVRELWLGNLSPNVSEGELRDILSGYGEIENIEDYMKPTTRFAFVKFRAISHASKLSESGQSLKNMLKSANLKIAFSDHQRRKNIIGNSMGYEIDEDLTSIVYIGYSTGATIASEAILREMFSSCGEVLNISINQMSKQNSAKSYALVEMGNREQAKYARHKLFFDDIGKEHRIRLGDKNCELCILAKPRAKESFHFPNNNNSPNQFMPRHHQQGFPHQPMMQPYRRIDFPHGPQNMHFNNGPMVNHREHMQYQNPQRNHFPHEGHHPQGYMGPGGIEGPNHHPHFMNGLGGPGNNRNMPNFGFQGGHPMGNNFFPGNPHFMNHGGFNPNFGPHPHNNGFIPNNNHMNPHFQQQQQQQGNWENNVEEWKRHNSNNMDYSDTACTTSTTGSHSKSPKEKGVFDSYDNNQEAIWSGFIVKSKQSQIGVDALLVQGDSSVLKNEYNISISHRITFDEIPKTRIRALVTFVPSDNGQGEAFNSLLSYFLERNRAGFVTLQDHILYLLPPCKKAFNYHQIGNNELLGVFFDSRDVEDKFDNKAKQRNKEEVQEEINQEDSSDLNEALSILKNGDFRNLVL